MSRRSRRCLGLALHDDRIVAALCRVNGQGSVERAETFAIEPPLSWDQPEALGQAFDVFLRERQMAGGAAVVGLPAKWILTRSIEMPPVAGEQERGAMIRLQAERAFRVEPGRLALDYVGAGATDIASPEGAEDGPSAQTSSQYLLAAVMRDRLERVRTMLQAAKLEPLACTVTSIAALRLVSGGIDNVAEAACIHLSRGGAELTLQRAGQVQLVRQLAGSMNGHGEAAGTEALLRDAVNDAIRSLSTAGGLSGELSGGLSDTDEAAPREPDIVMIDGMGVDPAVADRLTADVPRISRWLTLNGVAVQGAGPDGSGEREAGVRAAAAVALSVDTPASQRIDFLHSKLLEQKQARFSKPMRIAALVGVLVLILAGALAGDIWRKSSNIAFLQTQIETNVDAAKQAEQRQDKLRATRPWFSERPDHIGVWHAMSLAFPDEGELQARSLTVDEEMKVLLIGRTGNDATFFTLLDNLTSSDAFEGVRMRYLRDNNFAVECTYIANSGIAGSQNEKGTPRG